MPADPRLNLGGLEFSCRSFLSEMNTVTVNSFTYLVGGAFEGRNSKLAYFGSIILADT